MEEAIQKTINEWQHQWDVLQEVIDDMIKIKNYQDAFRFQVKATTIKKCIKELYLILEKNKTQ